MHMDKRQRTVCEAKSVKDYMFQRKVHTNGKMNVNGAGIYLNSICSYKYQKQADVIHKSSQS